MKKMPKIIQELLERLETVEVIEPKNKLPEGATIVGTMPEELQRLDALRRSLSEDHNKLVNALEIIEDSSEKDKISLSLKVARKKLDAIEQLFWIGLQTTFPELADKSSFGFAEGWRVYYKADESECQCLHCFLIRKLGI